MTRNLVLSAALLVGTLASTRLAHAEEQWFDSAPSATGYNCPVLGIVDGIQTWVGYVEDPSNRLKTGDSNYIHVVAKNKGCTLDGVTMEVFLPPGAIVDPNKQVFCIRESTSGVNNPINNCAPWGVNGPTGGLFFQSSVVNLKVDEYLEIQIPVIYNQELFGASAGHEFSVKTMNTFAAAWPEVPVTVGYRAGFQNLATTAVGLHTATFNANLFTHYKSGTLAFEYGTTDSYGQSTNPAPVPAGYLNFPGTTATPNNLIPATTYFWRARFVTSAGTFYGPKQTFTTSVPVLSVGTTGRGLGRITSNPTGLDCGPGSSNVCSVNVATGVTVTLYATPDVRYTFTGWSGACTGTGPCVVPMNTSKSVTANFEYATGTPISPPPGGGRR